MYMLVGYAGFCVFVNNEECYSVAGIRVLNWSMCQREQSPSSNFTDSSPHTTCIYIHSSRCSTIVIVNNKELLGLLLSILCVSYVFIL